MLPHVANTVWKGQLTFGLVSFPVRLLRAARKERVALKYVRESNPPQQPEADELEESPEPEISRVRQTYVPSAQTTPQEKTISVGELQRGYEVAPHKFVVVHAEELRKLRPATSPDLQILRSVRMEEIDPVFLETSYYVTPDAGSDRSYALFYRALQETNYATLAQLAMHGREHIMILRAANRGLIAHTMFYINEVRQSQQYTVDTTGVVGKELDLAKKFVQAIAEPFRPEEFTDRYREQLEALIASRSQNLKSAAPAAAQKDSGKVVDIMDALRRSLEITAAAAQRKPITAATALETKARKRKA